MKVTVTAGSVETGDVRTPEAEGDDYVALRDQLYAVIPDGWKAISVAVNLTERVE